MSNITKAHLDPRFVFKTTPLYQYDYGQILNFEGVELPMAYEVHFSNNDQKGTAKTVIGNQNGVLIPDEYLLTGEPVYAWVFLHAGEDDGETEYKTMIPVNKRPMKVDQQPTPVQQDAITEAIAKIQEIVDTAADTFGLLAMHINDDGHLIYTRTDKVDIDFAVDENGHLIFGGVA